MGKKFQISDQEIFDLVKEYQPILYQPKHDKHQPKFMYYRTRIRGSMLQITYYTVWDNERHPKYFFHLLYAFVFRKFYYGSIKDIEFIEVDIDLESKKLTDIRYEQPHKSDYHVTFPFHRPNHLKRVPDKAQREPFFIKFHGKNNDFHGFVKPKFTEKRVHMAVASWNHIYDLHLKDLDEKFIKFSNLLLERLDQNTFKKYKANRRSKPRFDK